MVNLGVWVVHSVWCWIMCVLIIIIILSHIPHPLHHYHTNPATLIIGRRLWTFYGEWDYCIINSESKVELCVPSCVCSSSSSYHTTTTNPPIILSTILSTRENHSNPIQASEECWLCEWSKAKLCILGVPIYPTMCCEYYVYGWLLHHHVCAHHHHHQPTSLTILAHTSSSHE